MDVYFCTLIKLTQRAERIIIGTPNFCLKEAPVYPIDHWCVCTNACLHTHALSHTQNDLIAPVSFPFNYIPLLLNQFS